MLHLRKRLDAGAALHRTQPLCTMPRDLLCQPRPQPNTPPSAVPAIDPAHPRLAALIVAAGRGLRPAPANPSSTAGSAAAPVLAQALAPFLAEQAIARVAVVIGEGDEDRYADAVGGLDPARLARPVTGGASRQESVRRGLQALSRDGFDGARPRARRRPPLRFGLPHPNRLGALTDGDVAAIPALPVTDTIKRLDAAGRIAETPPRDRLVSVQTPQVFALAPLLAAHEAAAAQGLDGFTDDAALMEWAGHPVMTFAATRPISS